jgi:sugar/nucleoside kinase (ribokinase family)
VTARPVVVVGDVGVDVLVRPHAPVVHGGDTTSDVRVVPGGAGGNTAAWLASVGVPVALVSRVGDDDAGAAARRRLEADGVVCRFVTDSALPTCTVVVLLEDDERTMLPDRGANAALLPEDMELAGAEAALPATGIPHLHLSGFVLLDPRSRPAGLAALERARSLGWTTSVDPQAANRVERLGAPAFLEWVEGVDLLLPNEIEARALGGDEAMLGVAAAAAVSMGAGGARWVTSTHSWRVPAPEVVEGDRTGCGDAFDAGVLSGWLSGEAPDVALARGVELGSRAAARTGARP